MFRKRNSITDTVKCEICSIMPHLRRIIIAMIIGAALIFISWIFFGGPCRVSLFFKIPGGGFTIALYYILWFVMFAIAGAECVLICTFGRRCNDNRALLLHIAVHTCMFIWYPLFFTTFTQFLALLIIIAAIVLLILEAKEVADISCLLTSICVVKIIILLIFAYINLTFLIIN